MDQANNNVAVPRTCEGVCVSLDEEKEKEHYLPGVGESSGSAHQPDQAGQNQASVHDGRAAATDGADLHATSVPPLLAFERTDEAHPPRRWGDGGADEPDDADADPDADRRDECPICNERFGASGDHRLALLHCDHGLCRRCLSRILRRARDPSRVQCPFCRQNTPLSHRDYVQITLEEEAYSNHGMVAAPGASSSHYSSSSSYYSSSPLLADGQLSDPQATPQGPLLAPGSEQQQQEQEQEQGQPPDGWGEGGGEGAWGSWLCPASVLEVLSAMRRLSGLLPSVAVLMALLLLLPWFFMSLRYL